MDVSTFLILAVAAQVSQQSQRCNLTGVWELDLITAIDPSGRPVRAPLGARVTGRLIYTADGHMAGLVSHGGRKRLGTEDFRRAPVAQRADAFATFFAYSGRYAVTGNRVVHHVEVASVPDWVGREMVRTVRCEDDKLALSVPMILVEGERRSFAFVWRRAD